MKLFVKVLLAVCCFSIKTVVYGQLSEGGKPISFKGNLKSRVEFIDMPAVDVEKLLKEDSINKDLGKPFRFGHEMKVDFSLNNSGKWEDLGEGGRVWRLGIRSTNAISINLIFKKYNLPANAQLFVYNQTKTEVLGAFTNRNNKESGVFSIAPIEGDAIVLEYYEPKNVKGQGQIELGKVVHAYKDILGFGKEKSFNFGGSGSCNMNVNCPDGSDWQEQRDAVAMIIIGGSTCSGSIINNTLEDGRPFLLSADHCLLGGDDTGEWIFVFNYESPNCSNIEGPRNHTVSGAQLRAKDTPSDFLLVELEETPPLEYNVFYAGWNNMDEPANNTVGIHHPSSDIKKISFDDDNPVSDAYYNFNNDTHWKVIWNRNTTTEPGSSGSPLFDQNKRIVGQLHGGDASCTNLTGYDLYGKFSYSWDAGSNATSRLKDWLDPNNSGVTTLDGGYINQAPCAGPIQGGEVETDQEVVCEGSPFTLFLTNATAGAGTTYEWEYSLDNIDWTSISSANSFRLTITQNESRYYRCKISCEEETAFSTSLFVPLSESDCEYIVPENGSIQITSCSGSIHDSGGPNGYYSNNNDGVATIYPDTEGQLIQLGFTQFSLEPVYDYLEIYNGTSTNAELIGTFTGTENPGNVYGTTSSGAITLRFVTDHSIIAPGFSANIECVTEVPDAELAIESVDLIPSTVAPGSTVIASLNIANTGGRTTHNDDLHFFFSTDDQWDENDTFIGTYTAGVIRPGATVPGDHVFTLPDQIDYNEYYILAYIGNLEETIERDNFHVTPITIGEQYVIPYTGSQVITTCSGPVSDHAHNNNYYPNSNGTLTIHPEDESSYLQLSFSRFQVEEDFDYLEIFDGATTSSPLIGEFSGHNLPHDIVASQAGGALTLRFYSDGSIEFRGFEAEISCIDEKPLPDVFIENVAVNFQSAFPDKYISVNATLTNNGSGVLLNSNISYYLSNDINYSPNDIHLGSSQNGAIPPNSSVTINEVLNIPQNTSQGNYYLILYENNNPYLDENDEARIAYIPIEITDEATAHYTMPESGQETITTCSQIITDHAGFQNNYDNNIDGTLVLYPEREGEMLTLSFIHFELEDLYDNLNVYDGTSTHAPLLGRLNGFSLPEDITATNPAGALTLRMVTDASVTESGFIAYVSCPEAETSDDLPDLTISTTTTPNNAIAGSSIDLSCTIQNIGSTASTPTNVHFLLSQKPDYNQDAINLGSSQVNSIEPEESLSITTQASIPENISGQFYILYYVNFEGEIEETNLSNNTYTEPINITLDDQYVVPHTGSQTITTCTGSVSDHARNSNYSPDANGTLTIHPEDQTSYLKLSFTRFQVEEDFDYLEIFDGATTSSPLLGKYSGHDLPHDIVATQEGGALTLRFYSDGSIEFRGFEAEISCLDEKPLPDVSIESAAVNFQSAFPDKYISVSATLTNNGSGTLYHSNISYYLSNDINYSQNDRYLGSYQSGTIPYNSSITINERLDIPQDISLGNYYIIIRENSNPYLGEDDEARFAYIPVLITDEATAHHTMPESGQESMTTCSQIITDHAGYQTNYADNIDGTLVLYPEREGEMLTLSFIHFEIEDWHDNLYVYDGTSTQAPLLGRLTGFSLPEDITATNPAGALTLRMVTDASVTESGFIAYVSCPGGSSYLPDLTISTPLNPSNAVAGSDINLSCIVQNIGTATSTPTSVHFFLSQHRNYSQEATPLGSAQVSSIEASSSEQVNTQASIPNNIEGQYYILYYIDYEGEVEESDISNNMFSVPIEITRTTSLREQQNSKVSVSPNPSNGIFHLSIEAPAQEVSINVYNSIGTEVFFQKTQINGDNAVYPIDLSFVPSGMYTVKLMLGQEVQVMKVIKK
ncbi:CUB domain-containing protein [Cytophagaceae bacterium ABcell3]|nr:CUB domain-containing protein [Cytophagaceae bacterium ABcell3]